MTASLVPIRVQISRLLLPGSSSKDPHPSFIPGCEDTTSSPLKPRIAIKCGNTRYYKKLS